MQDAQRDGSRLLFQGKNWLGLLKGNQILKRVILGLSVVAALACFLHFRQVRVEVLEVGAPAPRYVISQTDFSFLDEEATKTLRQEAARDIGAIFKVNEAQVSAFRRDLENRLIEQQQWRQALPRSTFEEVYSLLDHIEELFSQERFTDERTMHKMDLMHIPAPYFFPLSLASLQIESVELPTSSWDALKRPLEKGQAFYPETLDYLLAAFSHHVWKLQQDFSLERSVKQKVQSEIPGRFTRVEAGSQIIKVGEKVTPRHSAMVQAMQKALESKRNLWAPLTLLESVLIALGLMIAASIYLSLFHRELFKSLQKMVLLVTIILMSLALAKCVEYISLYSNGMLIEAARFPPLLPFASLLICVLIGSEVAVVASFFLLVVMGATLAVDYIPFLLINFLAATTTILLARKLHKRKEVFVVCGKVCLSILPMILAFHLTSHHVFEASCIADLLSAFGVLGMTAILAAGLLPILESFFQVMTDMTLMEYMDPDHELLRRLSLEAPGTYQHCLVVGNISEAAARCIGANGLFCRVSSLYHDIGKLFNPHYFTENQLGGFNIHQLLTPAESTHVIIAHVPEGEILARKYRLPQSFIDVMREHHGTTMVYYFYCKQVELMGGDATKVSKKVFRYPGPKPRSKESAIMMIVDTVEAASRSMEEVTEESMADMVDKLITEKAEDGQFDECRLTFEELGKVKRAIVKALMVTRHLRIKYPS
jgi:cyclic-di-AMP phosphodiesterase PgpH